MLYTLGTLIGCTYTYSLENQLEIHTHGVSTTLSFVSIMYGIKHTIYHLDNLRKSRCRGGEGADPVHRQYYIALAIPHPVKSWHDYRECNLNISNKQLGLLAIHSLYLRQIKR